MNLKLGSALIFFTSSTPSILGVFISNRAISKGFQSEPVELSRLSLLCWQIANAAAPVSASVTSPPQSFNWSRNTLRLALLGSTISSFSLDKSILGLLSGFWVLVCSCKLKLKQLPRPGLLLTLMSPAINSHSFFAIDRPRPVPPYLRVVEASIWVKVSNNVLCCSGRIPMPVSCTWQLNLSVFLP